MSVRTLVDMVGKANNINLKCGCKFFMDAIETYNELPVKRFRLLMLPYVFTQIKIKGKGKSKQIKIYLFQL